MTRLSGKDVRAAVQPDARRAVLVGGVVGSSTAFVIALVVLMLWPIPRFLRLSPGPSPDVAGLIKIEGLEAYPPESRLGLALVIVAPVDNLFELARSSLDETSEVRRRHELIPDETTDAENDARNAELMTASKEDAVYVALRHLGFEVKASGKGARVTEVFQALPATGVLVEGDVITSVDGQSVSLADDAVDIVVARHPGDSVKLGVQRNGEHLEIELVTVESPDEPGRPIVGVHLETHEPSFALPAGLKVEIDAGGIGGPSAGLIYAIGVIDALTPGDITGGHDIAATGEIRLDGSVGAVGGLREKAVGVERGGAEYFLVPAGDNFEEAERAAGRMRVVPVHDLNEALHFLQGLRNGEELLSPAR